MPVPNELEVFYDEKKPPILCRIVEEVDTALDELHENAGPILPLAVSIRVFGHEIDLGVGSDPTFLCLQFEPCDGEHYSAVGGLTEGEHRMFYGAGQDSYWAPKYLIPLADARSAVRYFIGQQRGSPDVCWEDWAGRIVTPDASSVSRQDE